MYPSPRLKSRLRPSVGAGRSLVAALALASSSAVLLAPAPSAAAAPPAAATTSGTDFWVTFPPNYTDSGPTFTLFISGPQAATGTVTQPGGATTAFSVTPGAVTSVAVTSAVPQGDTDNIVDQGVHIAATAPVTVYGLNALTATSDAYTALPTGSLGTRYRIASYTPLASSYPSRATVVATQDATTVTVTPTVTIGSHAAGVAYTESLSKGQVYTVASGASDITGTLISADKPVAVYGSVDCADINVGGNGGACDVIMQQMPPTTSWGTDFLAVRFLKAANGDPFRVIADTDGTVVTVNGGTVATLNAGQYYDGVYGVPPDGATLNVGVHISTSKPAMVIQYQTGGSYSQGSTTASGDPSMMLVPPYQQFLNNYTVATPPSQFIVNDANVVIPTSAIASLRLDGAAVAAPLFAPIAGTNFSSAQLPLTLGSHTLTADLPFGVWVYGENEDDSYAYPGGYSTSPVASIAAVTPQSSTYTAQTDQQVCIPVTVTDSNGAGVPGVRVDAAVSGADTASTFATTASDGTAQVCYTPTNVGTDTVALSAGTATSTATVTIIGPPSFTPTTVTQAGDAGTAYSYSPTESGGTAPIAYTFTGLPAGLSGNPSTGAITGTLPSTPGPLVITVTAADTNELSGSQTIDLAVNPDPTLSTTTGSAATDVGDSDFNFEPPAPSGGTGPLLWSATGLPAGVTVDPSTGALNGTPSTAGTYTVVLTATDADGQTVVDTVTITVADVPPKNGTAVTIAGEVGASSTWAAPATTGGTAPWTWAADGLPDGVTIDPVTGSLSGTPTIAGTTTGEVIATDAKGHAETFPIDFTVTPPPVFTAPTAPGATAGVDYSLPLTATGGSAPFVWSVSAGSLPAGLTLDQATGAISGIPSGAGTYTFTVTATDAFGETSSAALTITVASTLQATHPIASTPDGKGYWVTDTTGHVTAYGDAGNFGSVPNDGHAPIVGIAATPDGQGYWLVGRDGGVFTFGDAGFYGSTGGIHLNKPILGISATPDGRGYWMVASDGGVFSFGDAGFYGSTGGIHLAAPVVGLAPTSDGAGYRLIGSDGGVFDFGDATFEGSAAGIHLAGPIIGVATSSSSHGYWLVGTDGGVFTFGDAHFLGSTGGRPIDQSVIGMAATPDATGYWLLGSHGGVFTFGSAQYYGAPTIGGA